MLDEIVMLLHIQSHILQTEHPDDSSFELAFQNPASKENIPHMAETFGQNRVIDPRAATWRYATFYDNLAEMQIHLVVTGNVLVVVYVLSTFGVANLDGS
jgi:hypothetical protein